MDPRVRLVWHGRNTSTGTDVHTADESAGNPVQEALGEANVQSTQPRDVAALVFVIGLFAVLLVVSLTVGSPTR
jgi:hypothetical protein